MSCQAVAVPDIPASPVRDLPKAPPPPRFEPPAEHQTGAKVGDCHRSRSPRDRMAPSDTIRGWLNPIGTSDDEFELSQEGTASSATSSPEPLDLPAETASRGGFGPFEVPTRFSYNAHTCDFDIYWQWPGALESRTVLFDNVDYPGRGQVAHLPEEDLYDIPEDARAVISRLVKPLRYPINCPKLNHHILDFREKQGPEWLPHGRAAFFDGLREGHIPRNCTTRPFKSTKLGLYYRGAGALTSPTHYVLIVEPSLSVKNVDRQVEMGELEVNSDDSDNESDNRFEVPTECNKAKYAPLMHNRKKALDWDERMFWRYLKPVGMTVLQLG